MTPPVGPPRSSSTSDDGDDWDDFEDWSEEPLDSSRTDRDTGRFFDGLEDDPRVQSGVEHLQRAAHEVIAASRALLDVAEEVVDSPDGVKRMFGILGELGDLAGRLARPAAGRSDHDDPDGDPPVQRIPVS